MEHPPQGKRLRGFARMKALDPEAQLRNAQLGGSSVPAEKRAFAQDTDLAQRAGRKGGSVSPGMGKKRDK